jgi:shikimate kinase
MGKDISRIISFQGAEACDDDKPTSVMELPPVHLAALIRYPQTLRHLFDGGGDVIVKRILLTGMSGTGKSTIICELAARGYKAVDADCDEFSEWVEVIGGSDSFESPVEVDRDWVWQEDRIQDLLSTEDTDVLFLSGCAENMGKFLPQFDHVILLSSPADVIVERLRTRTTNLYGKHPDEIARVLGLVETVEPLLRRAARHEIDTSKCLEEVVATLLRLVQIQQ